MAFTDNLNLSSIENSKLNETQPDHSHDEIEMSFMHVNSDDEIEEKERDGSPVVRMRDDVKLDSTMDTNYATEKIHRTKTDLHDNFDNSLQFSPAKGHDYTG